MLILYATAISLRPSNICTRILYKKSTQRREFKIYWVWLSPKWHFQCFDSSSNNTKKKLVSWQQTYHIEFWAQHLSLSIKKYTICSCFLDTNLLSCLSTQLWRLVRQIIRQHFWIVELSLEFFSVLLFVACLACLLFLCLLFFFYRFFLIFREKKLFFFVCADFAG